MTSPEPTPARAGRAVVVIPTFNEVENLEQAVAAVRAAVPDIHVLVVDDSSPDGTGELADRLAAADPQLDVLHRTQRAGLGQAYLAGFARALDEGYEVIIEMDADGSHPASALPAMLARLDEPDHADLVIGSRWVPGGGFVDWPASRQALSRGGNWYTQVALGIPVRDATGGYRAYRAEVLRRLALADVESRGYCFQIDMTRRLLDAGFVVAEVPITFVERQRGTSKMSSRIVIEAMFRVTVWGVARRFSRRKPAQARTALPSDTAVG